VVSKLEVPGAEFTSVSPRGCGSPRPRATTHRGLWTWSSTGRHDGVEVPYADMTRSPALLRKNSRLVDELRASRLPIVQTGERERRRLEQDLHDGAPRGNPRAVVRAERSGR
jgi:hypothetical protein